MTAAMSGSLSVPFHAGIWPLYVVDPTMILPLSPSFTIWMTLSGGPVTTALPASGGKTPGCPLPLAWWQLEQLVVKTFMPFALAIAPPAIVAPDIAELLAALATGDA